MTDADVLVVGGGIAGWSAAYFARGRGRRVTLVDEGVHRASDLPVALVNPLRGHAGRLVAHGVDGMHATFALVDALRGDGHDVASARGLYRPLIDRTGDARDEAFWRATVGGQLAFDWHARAPSTLGLADPPPTLFLRDAGWVAPAGLLAALASASGATRIAARVVAVGPAGAVLADGSTIAARATLWCGGAWGSAVLDGGRHDPAGLGANDGANDHAHDDAHDGARAPADVRTRDRADHPADDDPRRAARYRPGSLLASAAPFVAAPLSFGLYAVPDGDRTIVGPTREDARPTFSAADVPEAAVRHLADRLARTFGRTIALDAMWRGVRLARLSARATDALGGTPTLTALGSRGFLMAPLLAAAWARSL